MNFDELVTLLRRMLPDDDRPVLAYTGLFALARAFPPPPEAVPKRVLDSLLEAVGVERTLLLPTYTRGYSDGFIDLDATPCTTGMVNELFRRMPGTRRTRSAFFSFAARGPDASELAELRPAEAWGEGSLFDWVARRNTQVVMLGVPWSMCSFLHYAEWVCNVPYRYRKEFAGECFVEGRREPLVETLFVRSLDPVVENAWPGLDELLAPHGMVSTPIGRSQLASADARAILDAVVPILRRDPFTFVRDPERLRATFVAKILPSNHVLTASNAE